MAVRQAVGQNTLVVLASILIVGIIVCLFDWLANEGVTLLGKF